MSTSGSSHMKRKPQLWHRDLQVYVAAFQYLTKLQEINDKAVNNGTTKSDQLNNLLDSAVALLCDMENTINSTTANLRKPRGRIQMAQKLDYNQTAPYYHKVLDVEFTIQKFYQYVTDLDGLLERRVHRLSNPQHHHRREHKPEPRNPSRERQQNVSGQQKRQRKNGSPERRKNQINRELVDNNLSATGSQVLNSNKNRHLHEGKRQRRKHKSSTTSTTVAP